LCDAGRGKRSAGEGEHKDREYADGNRKKEMIPRTSCSSENVNAYLPESLNEDLHENVRCGVGDDEFLIHPSTPTNIYILNPYKFIGDDEMILEEETFKKIEYKSSIGIAEIIGCSAGSVLDALVNLNISRRGYSDYYGELHHSYGKTLSEETRLLISEHHIDISGENHPLYGKHHSEEAKKKIGESHIGLHTGEKNPNWRGGVSFEPYCTKFNNTLKEEIRDKFGRKCFLCPKTEEEEGRKLSVHHVDYNKEQGCNGVRWLLVPLCMSCNGRANFNREYWQDLITEKLRQEGYL